jgi:Nitroreductase family
MPQSPFQAPHRHTRRGHADATHGKEMIIMNLYDVMRTTHAVREFTDEPLPDDTLYRILDNARFAPSGGNRQGTHITVVRAAQTRQRLAELGIPGARRYIAQLIAGENPWNPVHPSSVAPEIIDNTDPPDSFITPFIQAPVVLVVSVDLEVVAALDQNLDRIGLVSGASVYPGVEHTSGRAQRGLRRQPHVHGRPPGGAGATAARPA